MLCNHWQARALLAAGAAARPLGEAKVDVMGEQFAVGEHRLDHRGADHCLDEDRESERLIEELIDATHDHEFGLGKPSVGEQARCAHLVLGAAQRFERGDRDRGAGAANRAGERGEDGGLLLSRDEHADPPASADVAGDAQPPERIATVRRDRMQVTHVSRVAAQGEPGAAERLDLVAAPAQDRRRLTGGETPSVREQHSHLVTVAPGRPPGIGGTPQVGRRRSAESRL